MTDEKSGDTLGSEPKASKTDQLSQKILGSMKKKTFSGEETIAWLKDINENIGATTSNNRDKEKQHLTMLSCIDTMFDHFQRYVFELMQTQPTDKDYELHCQRPNYSLAVNRCYGYLSNKNIGLVVEGEPELIRAFIIPAAFLADFEARRNDFTPFMEMSGRSDSGGVVWEIEGGPIVFSDLPVIAKKLFARLVRVIRGEASELEPFTLDLAESVSKAAPAESIAVVVDQVFEQNKTSISAACTGLLLAIDQEIDILVKTGVRAMQLQKNMELTPRIIKRKNSLRALQQMAEALQNELTDVLAEE